MVFDDLAEAAEVHVDDVVDLERLAGLLEQLLDRLDRQARAAELVGGVDLVRAVAGDLDLEVARHRHHRGRLLVGVEADEDDRVRARLEPELLVPVALVGAEDHQRLRLAGLRAIDLGDLDRRAALLLDRVDERVRLQEARRRHAARGEQHDHEPGQRAAFEQAAARRSGPAPVGSRNAPVDGAQLGSAAARGPPAGGG